MTSGDKVKIDVRIDQRSDELLRKLIHADRTSKAKLLADVVQGCANPNFVGQKILPPHPCDRFNMVFTARVPPAVALRLDELIAGRCDRSAFLRNLLWEHLETSAVRLKGFDIERAQKPRRIRTYGITLAQAIHDFLETRHYFVRPNRSTRRKELEDALREVAALIEWAQKTKSRLTKLSDAKAAPFSRPTPRHRKKRRLRVTGGKQAPATR